MFTVADDNVPDEKEDQDPDYDDTSYAKELYFPDD